MNWPKDFAYNLPYAAPAFRLPPFKYNHIRRLSIVLETDPKGLREIVPPPLEVIGNKYVIWIEHRVDENPSPSPHHYPHPFNTYEASVDVPVKFRNYTGTNIPLMYVPATEQDFGRAVAGRELQGIGKKLAHFYFEERLLDDTIVIKITRNNVDLVSVEAKLTGDKVELPTKPPMIGVKMVPKVEGDGFDLYKVVAVENFQYKAVASKGGKIESIRFGRSEEDPFYKIQPSKVHGCLFTVWTGQVIQPCGRELGDLLKEQVAVARVKR